MQDLFRKVVEGRVPMLPVAYSKDLNNMVKLLLQQSPKLRPTCAEIASKSIKNLPPLLKFNTDQIITQEDLISTIKVPRNLTHITGRLPTANYESQKGLRRNASHHAMLRDVPLSARGDLIMRNNLAVIPESREEIIRSVDMRRTKSTEKIAREIRGVGKPPIKQSDKEYKK
jgi:hypothetical protein